MKKETLLINRAQVAQRLNISDRHWRRLVEQGRAPQPVRLGRATRWTVADIDQFIANRGQMPNRKKRKS